MEPAVITIQDVADAHSGLSGAHLCLQRLPRVPLPRRDSRRLFDLLAINVRALRALAKLPDPYGHAPALEQVVAQLETVRAEARRFF